MVRYELDRYNIFYFGITPAWSIYFTLNLGTLSGHHGFFCANKRYF